MTVFACFTYLLTASQDSAESGWPVRAAREVRQNPHGPSETAGVGKEQLRRCADTGDELSVGLGDNGDNPRRATRWPRTEGEKRMKISAPLLSTAIRLTYHI